MSVTVREAEPSDWDCVAGLLAELGRPAVLGTAEAEEHRARYHAYVARPDAVALLAEDGGVAVGFCDLEFRARLNFTRPQAWIPDLIVTEAARSRGAGFALLARAQEIARARGCWGLTLESATWRERAHAFYEREGIAFTGKSFSVSLTGEIWPPPPR